MFSVAMIWTATVESIRLPWYEPLQRRFLWSAQPPSPVAMDFYARIAIAFAAAVASGSIAGWITAKRKPGDGLLRAIGIWAIGITLLGMFLYAYTFATRVIEAPLHR